MSRLSDLVNYQVNEAPNVMEIRTEKIEPLSSNTTDRIYKFRIEPQGFLDSNSLLQFKLDRPSTNTNTNVRVNCWNGAFGSIKRVIFQVGDFILNDTDGVNQIMTLKNMASRRRVNLNRREAWYHGNQFVTKTSTTADESFGQFEPDTDLGGYDFSDSTANSLEITATTANNFKYGIKLGDLIPALKNQQIPLFLFDQYRIYITVEFHSPSVFCNSDANTTLAAADTDVAISSVQLLTDYIIYPSSVLEKVRENTQKEGGLVLDFVDWVKVERQLVVAAGTQTAVTTNANYQTNGTVQDATTSEDFRIGMENKEVHDVVMWKQSQDKDSLAEAKILLQQRCDGITHEEVQWEVNGVPVFPNSIKNTAQQYDQVYMSQGYNDLQVERPMYFNDRNSLVSGLAQASSGLVGTFKPQAYDLKVKDVGVLGSGTMMGRYPLVCKYKTAPALSLTTYGIGDTGNSITSKQDGTYNVDFFVSTSRRAIIQSTAKGMTVSVLS